MNVISYLRVSGKSQVEGDGFDRQAEAIQKFCPAHGLMLVREFREQVSGKTEGLDRPVFLELLEWIEQCEYDRPVAIVVERMDRLARTLMTSEILLKECRDRGIKVFAADRDALVDSASGEADPTAILIRQVLAAVAELVRNELVRKLHAARVRTGRFGGEPMLGKRPGEDRIIIYLREARGRGDSYARIVETMNSLGMTNRRGKAWDKRTVQRVAKRLGFDKPTTV